MSEDRAPYGPAATEQRVDRARLVAWLREINEIEKAIPWNSGDSRERRARIDLRDRLADAIERGEAP